MDRYNILVKKILFLLVTSTPILLGACGMEATEDTKRMQLSASKESVQEAVYCGGEMTATEHGVVFSIDSQSGGILQYYDYISEKTYPFCSNVNCEHTDDSCDAWFDSMVNGPAIYGDSIYLFSFDNESNNWYFLSMDADGTNRRHIAEIKSSDFSCDYLMPANGFWYENDTVTFVASCGFWEDGEDFLALVVLDLSSGRINILSELSEENNVLAYENDVFFICRGDCDEPLLEMDEFYSDNDASADYDEYYSEWYRTQYRTIYYLLDTKSGEITDLLTIPGSEEEAEWDFDHLTDEGIYYGTAGDTIYGVDFANKILTTVYQSESQKSIECAADGNIFFLQLDEERRHLLANSYLNTTTNEITDLHGRISGGGWIYGSADGYFIGNSQSGYICISKDDFYTSNFDRVSVMK